MSETAIAFWMFVQSIMLGPVADGASAPPAEAARPGQAGLECRLDAETSRGETVVLAKVSAGATAGSGRFLLKIEKKGANTSNSRQRGAFEVAAGTSRTVGTVRVPVGTGNRIEGQLVLYTAEGERFCTF